MGIDPADGFVDALLPQRTRADRVHFLFEQFQIELPPDWNPIILPAKVGIGPVGVRP
ncbi:MAG: hypothetical protein Q8M19_07490 [Reyranella sp.]|nr:hypothetical protein [Reyranella sp.]